jgi:hypothetical protein
MTETAPHVCKFHFQKLETPWSVCGAYRERSVERIGVCAACGKRRTSRFRKIVFLEREGTGAAQLSAPDLRVQRLARTLDRRFQSTEAIHARQLIRRLGGVHAEADLERLAMYGGVRLIYQPRAGSLNLHAVHVVDRAGLAEIAEPGARERRRTALQSARRSTIGLNHPQAQAIADLLADDSATLFDHQIVSALAGLARLIEDGEVLPERLFSVKYLGHSKRLRSIRRRLERLAGPLERLGIRDSGQTVLIGGQGILALYDVKLDLSRFHYLGLSVDDTLQIREIDFPSGGLLVVENLTPFHACLTGLSQKHRFMTLWTAGFPGRGVRAIIRRAAEREVPVRIWCDLDLGGVRIARIVAQLAQHAEPVLMDPETIRTANVTQRIEPELMMAMRRDLTLHPDDLLAQSIRELLQRGAWVEQEVLLDRIEAVFESQKHGHDG